MQSAVPGAQKQHLLGEEPTNLVSTAKYILENDIRRILVLTGAGVSVAAGIPDFRSPSSGIYANLGKYNLDEPTDAFSIALLRERPSIFYAIAREMNLWPGTYAPTAVHHFIKLLADEGRLLRCCTQNIDGLERAAGLAEGLLVEAHGSFSTASCIECHAPFDIAQNRSEAQEGLVSHCKGCGGIVKPDVVFFGEQLPEAFFSVLMEDTAEAQMVIIIGTSLQVHPFAALPLRVPESVPRVVINMERVGGHMFRFPQDEELPTPDSQRSSSAQLVMSGEEDGSHDGSGTAVRNGTCASGAGSTEPHDTDVEKLTASHSGSRSESSSSDGYAQYGTYDGHPHIGRDAFFPGDCQETIFALADHMGLGERLRSLCQRPGGSQ